MLTIRRGPGEGIVIGDTVMITVLAIDGARVRLVIENPQEAGDVQIVDCPANYVSDEDDFPEDGEES
jgi:hypothetical protein